MRQEVLEIFKARWERNRPAYEFLARFDGSQPQPKQESNSLDRPSWDDYFLGLAFMASRRSLDPSTKHGCILVDEHRHIVAVGYNGFPHNLDDSSLPLTRPEKYPWMDHSEVNAIANATGLVRGSTAYITGKPCFECAKALYRHGVLKWVVAQRRGFTKESPEDLANYARLIEDGGVEVRWLEPDLNWLYDDGLYRELHEHSFINMCEVFSPSKFSGT